MRRLATSRRDSGVVAILTALLMTVFLGFCAFSVDFGHWFLVRQQTQKAADAAALAAVVNLPDNWGNAQTTATQFASLNGYTPSASTTVTTNKVTGDPGSLSVTVTTTVSNFFTSMFGVPTTTIASTAYASYVGPVKMGSPCNRLGSDPEAQTTLDSPACAKAAGRLWVNINASGSAKEEGDPFNTQVCSGGEDLCAGGSNQEYRSTGYLYDITLKKRGPLSVQIFDAPWVDVGKGRGNQCNSDALTGLSPATLDPQNPSRYAAGDTSEYCTGDSATAPAGDPPFAPTSTTFTLHSAKGDPLAPETHDVLQDCLPMRYAGYEPKDKTELSDKLTDGNAAYDPTLRATFRRWTTLCSLADVPAGTYVLQVTTGDRVPAGNRFALRATTTVLSDVTVSGHGAMDLFANDTSKKSSFYLARVPGAAAGQTLHVRFFDVGDCSKLCTLTVVDPGGNTATGCRSSSGPTVTGCSFVALASFNGKWVDLLVPVPKTYSCNEADTAACWYQVAYSGGAPHDVTAWTAEMEGQPVRLTQ